MNEKNYKPKKKNGNVGGLNIINFKKDIVYINSNSPPLKNFSNCYQSGPLSFEYFNDEDKIITNCGFGKNISNKAIFFLVSLHQHNQPYVSITLLLLNSREIKLLIKLLEALMKKVLKFLMKKMKTMRKKIKFYASHDAYLKKFGYICSREIKIFKKDYKITGRDFFEKKEKQKKLDFQSDFI